MEVVVVHVVVLDGHIIAPIDVGGKGVTVMISA